MIVYGDPSCKASTATFLHGIGRFENNVQSQEVDSSRSTLIRAGQLEQGMADGDSTICRRLLPRVEAITEAAARRFIYDYMGLPCGDSKSAVAEACHGALQSLGGNECELTIKIPEGFALYNLYPEQYVTAALNWASTHRAQNEGHVAVIGVRSIGTSLSAVISETLRANGWRTVRCSVRPYGHPFDRKAHVPEGILPGADYAIVVDEGPGLSGSSMAAVAEALAKNGFPAKGIFFFPAHLNEPGAAASEPVREWWSKAPRIVAGLDEIHWDGKTLLENLRDRTRELLNSRVIRVEEASRGLWRRHAFPDESDWPAVTPAFERAKYIFTLADERKVLWKFTGLHSSNRRCNDAATGTIRQPARLGQFRGFTAEEWIPGERLTPASAPGLAIALGEYVRKAAAPPINAEDAVRGIERLSEMLSWNAREALGDQAGARARELADACRDLISSQRHACYGDGRMAPHEFVRGTNSVIYKTDSSGHDEDHTIAGRQSVLWDVAGVLVEWDLSEFDERAFLTAAEVEYEPKLTFHVAAYTAFRLGMLAMTADVAESSRVRATAERYRAHLTRTLGSGRAIPATIG